MYAIISTGGKQTQVRPGDLIRVEKLKTYQDEVGFVPLLVSDQQGTVITEPEVLENCLVLANVTGEVKGDKIRIFKYKSKTGYRRRLGHRQRYSQLEVTEIRMPEGWVTESEEEEPAVATADETSPDMLEETTAAVSEDTESVTGQASKAVAEDEPATENKKAAEESDPIEISEASSAAEPEEEEKPTATPVESGTEENTSPVSGETTDTDSDTASTDSVTVEEPALEPSESAEENVPTDSETEEKAPELNDPAPSDPDQPDQPNHSTQEK